MDIIIQSTGFKHAEPLAQFINEKVEGLKSDRIVRANVTLFLGPESEPENKYCEILLEVPGNDHFVKKNGTSFEVAVADCVEVLTQQIKKSKDKHNDRRQGDSAQIQDAIISAENDLEEPELEDVVK